MQEGQVLSAREAKIEVQMSLANETTYPHHGAIDFVDNTVDPSTDNVRLRAQFDNSDRKLLPGLFARVRVPFTAPHQAIMIPTVALATDQQGQYVMVVQVTSDNVKSAEKRQHRYATCTAASTVYLGKSGEQCIDFH